MILIYEIAGIGLITTIIISILEKYKSGAITLIVEIAGVVASALLLMNGAGPTIEKIINIIGV